MSHTITFIGSENPNCFTSNFLEVPDPALVIESELVNNCLPLGNIFELQANSTGPDVVTVFGREDSGPVSQFHSVQVTLFGGVFESEATVRNDQLTISTSSGSVFGYPAELTITAPSNKTDWQDLEFTVDSSLLSGSGSFIESLSEVVTRKLRMLAESANSRREVAQMSLNQSEERLLAIEERYNQTVANLSVAEQKRDAASRIATMSYREVEQQLNDSQDLLQDSDKLCTEEICIDVCMPGVVCRHCSKPYFLRKTVNNCIVRVFNSLVESTCCENVTCAVRAPDPSCIARNEMCGAMQHQSAVDSLQNRRDVFQEFLEAQRNLSLAKAAQNRAGDEHSIYENRARQLVVMLEKLRDAHNNSLTVYERTLESAEPLLRLFGIGHGSGYQNVFSINHVTFNTKLTNSPTSLAFNVVFQNLIDNSGTEYRESYLYISRQPEAVNLERMADGIIDTAFIGESKRGTLPQTRLRRQTAAAAVAGTEGT
ncbi:hypothetical protein GBAR_LOCUS25116 [Geodia barretti]|uniref:Uncharacterized protein n=1 Tax=Geodia barretti TaxID=519541 RepID=A0AA35TDY8_GEOBA|nr:hypothetical protein GBAR_LOCUS25116 [Geodia barretti]